MPEGLHLVSEREGGGLSGDALAALIVPTWLRPVALMVVVGKAGNAQRGEKVVEQLGAGDAAVPATSAEEDDVKPSGQALLRRWGGWGGGSGDVMVDDDRRPDVDGSHNGENHIWEAGVREQTLLYCWVDAGVAAQVVGVRVVQVGHRCGNVHAPKCLQTRVSSVLPNAGTDEFIGGEVMVAGELRGRGRCAVQVDLHPVVGNRFAQPVEGQQIDARWGHG